MSFNDYSFEKETENEQEILVEKVEVVKEEELPKEQENDIVEVNDTLADYQILNPELPMPVKVNVAVSVANCLSDVIRSQDLVKTGLNKKDPNAEYVLIDGWEILGTMLGITPVSRITGEIKNKQGRTVGYKARAYLYRNATINYDADGNEIISGTLVASAEASADKTGWQKEGFSMMSMAQTRALSKSYRSALGWIMKMAKFEPTPAEEMPDYK